MTKLTNPVPLFLDGRGALLDGGYIYIGQPGTDPRLAANRLNLFWDSARTIPAAQPLRTLGGAIVNGLNQAQVFFAEQDHSTVVTDADNSLVTYQASAFDVADTPVFQPLDDDLTAIAGQGNTAFGRGLLTLANSAALKSAASVVDGLPLTGGTVSGNINRASAGAHLYFADPLMTGVRVFGPHPEGTADATSQPGDMQFFY